MITVIKRAKFAIATIAMMLVVSFVAYDIAWAYPDRPTAAAGSASSTLAPSPFSRSAEAPARFYGKAVQSVIDLVENTGIPRQKLTIKGLKAIFNKNKVAYAESGDGVIVTLPGYALHFYGSPIAYNVIPVPPAHNGNGSKPMFGAAQSDASNKMTAVAPSVAGTALLVLGVIIHLAEIRGDIVSSVFLAGIIIMGGLLLLFGVARYVSMQRQVLAELLAEQMIVQMLMDYMPDAIYFKDSKSRFTRVSKHLVKRLGFDDPKYAIGRTDFDFFDKEHAQQAFDDEEEIMRTGVPIVNKEEREELPDGTVRWVLTTKMPLYDRNGKIAGTFGMSRDITDRVEAREFLTAVINNIKDPVFVKDKNHRFVAVNDAECELMGRHRKDILGKTDEDFYGNEFVQEFWKGDDTVFSTRQDSEKMEKITMPSGEVRMIRTKKKLYTSGGQDYLVGVIEDITEQKKQEDELRQSNSLLSSTVESTFNGVLVVDRQGKIRIFNKKFVEMWGIPDSVVETQDDNRALDFVLSQLKHPELFIKKVRELYDTPERESHDLIEFKDGRIFERYSRPQKTGDLIIGRVWTFHDITERKEAEDTLRASEEKFRGFTRASSYGMGMGKLDGRVMAANEALCSIVREPTEASMMRNTFLDYYSEDGRKRLEEEILPIVVEKGQWIGEIDLVAVDGTVTPTEQNIFVIPDKDGKVSMIGNIITDITARKNMEANMREAAKSEALSLAAGGIAHDFNNLLTPIMGYASMLDRQLHGSDLEKGLKDKLRGYLEQILEAVNRGQSLARQLLTFAKGGKPVKQTFLIPDFLREQVRFMLSGSNVRADFYIPNNIWPVDADKGQISQVLQNLVLNARQAMPTGGAISVTAENIEVTDKSVSSFAAGIYRSGPATRVVKTSLAPGKYIKVSIKDTGIGIPAKIIDRIFDLSFTTKAKGSGFGLPVSYSIVTNHDGSISVESEQGRGSTFTFYLPASPDKSVKASHLLPRIALRKGEERRPRILVMDDDDYIRDLLKGMLGGLGYDCDTSSDGVHAIAAWQNARKAGKPYDLVIMDLTIPGGMGGVDTIKELRKFDPNVRAIVSSGYSDDASMSNARLIGFAAVLPKPYSEGKLSRVVADTLKNPVSEKDMVVLQPAGGDESRPDAGPKNIFNTVQEMSDIFRHDANNVLMLFNYLETYLKRSSPGTPAYTRCEDLIGKRDEFDVLLDRLKKADSIGQVNAIFGEVKAAFFSFSEEYDDFAQEAPPIVSNEQLDYLAMVSRTIDKIKESIRIFELVCVKDPTFNGPASADLAQSLNNVIRFVQRSHKYFETNGIRCRVGVPVLIEGRHMTSVDPSALNLAFFSILTRGMDAKRPLSLQMPPEGRILDVKVDIDGLKNEALVTFLNNYFPAMIDDSLEAISAVLKRFGGRVEASNVGGNALIHVRLPLAAGPAVESSDSGSSDSGQIARGEPLGLYFAFRDQFRRRGEDLPRLRQEIDRQSIASELRKRLEEKKAGLPGGDNTYWDINQAINDLEKLDAREFDAIVLDGERARKARSWLLGFNTNAVEPARGWKEPDKKANELEASIESIFNYNMQSLIHEPTLGYASQVLDRLSGEALSEYLLHEALCVYFGHRRSRRIQEILFAGTNYSRAPPGQEFGKKDGPVSAALNDVIENAPIVLTPQMNMLAMMRLARERLELRLKDIMLETNIYREMIELGRLILGAEGAHTDEEYILALAMQIISSEGPLAIRPDHARRYKIFYENGQLCIDVVARLLYELERAGAITPDLLFQTMQKYSGRGIEMKHVCYPARPPLRDELRSIDVSYSTKGGGGVGDLKQMLTVAKIVRRHFPDATVRLLYEGRRIGDIKLFYPDFDPEAGVNTFDGIEIVPGNNLLEEDEARLSIASRGSADITISNYSISVGRDNKNHSPVQILVDEYGWKHPIDINPIMCPAVFDRVVTGPGEGLFLSEDMERMKAWWDALAPEEKIRQRRAFARKLLESAPAMKDQQVTDEAVDVLASGKWAWMYAGEIFQHLGANIFYQSISEMSSPDKIFFFTINLPIFEVDAGIPLVGTPQDLLNARPGTTVIVLEKLSHEDFLKFMLMSDLPFMITGDGSLTEAMQSKRPFIYEVRKHKMMLRENVPFYFIVDKYATGVDLEQDRIDAENAEQKKRFKEFLARHYPDFPSWDMALVDVEAQIVNAIDSTWQAHRARLNDPAFRALYNNIELRWMNYFVPGSVERYLPDPAPAAAGPTDMSQPTKNSQFIKLKPRIPTSLNYSETGPLDIVLAPGGKEPVRLHLVNYADLAQSDPLKARINREVGFVVQNMDAPDQINGLHDRRVLRLGRDNAKLRITLTDDVDGEHLWIERAGDKFIFTDKDSKSGTSLRFFSKKAASRAEQAVEAFRKLGEGLETPGINQADLEKIVAAQMEMGETYADVLEEPEVTAELARLRGLVRRAVEKIAGSSRSETLPTKPEQQAIATPDKEREEDSRRKEEAEAVRKEPTARKEFEVLAIRFEELAGRQLKTGDDVIRALGDHEHLCKAETELYLAVVETGGRYSCVNIWKGEYKYQKGLLGLSDLRDRIINAKNRASDNIKAADQKRLAIQPKQPKPGPTDMARERKGTAGEADASKIAASAGSTRSHPVLEDAGKVLMSDDSSVEQKKRAARLLENFPQGKPTKSLKALKVLTDGLFKNKADEEVAAAIIEAIKRIRATGILKKPGIAQESIIGMIWEAVRKVAGRKHKHVRKYFSIAIDSPLELIKLCFGFPPNESFGLAKITRLENLLRRNFLKRGLGPDIETSHKKGNIAIRFKVTMDNLTEFWRQIGTSGMKFNPHSYYRAFTNEEFITEMEVRARSLAEGFPDNDSGQYRDFVHYVWGDGTEKNPGLIGILRNPEKCGDLEYIRVESDLDGSSSGPKRTYRELARLAEYNPYFSHYIPEEGIERWIYFARAAGSVFETAYIKELFNGRIDKDFMFFVSAESLGEDLALQLSGQVRTFVGCQPSDTAKRRIKNFAGLRLAMNGWLRKKYYAQQEIKIANTSGWVKFRKAQVWFDVSGVRHEKIPVYDSPSNGAKEIAVIERSKIPKKPATIDKVRVFRQNFRGVRRAVSLSRKEIDSIETSSGKKNVCNELDIMFPYGIKALYAQLRSTSILRNLAPGDDNKPPKVCVIDEMGVGSRLFLMAFVIEELSRKSADDIDETQLRSDCARIIKRDIWHLREADPFLLSDAETQDLQLLEDTIKNLRQTRESIDVEMFLGKPLKEVEEVHGYPSLSVERIMADYGFSREKAESVIDATTRGADAVPHSFKAYRLEDPTLPVYDKDIPIRLETKDVHLGAYLKAILFYNYAIEYYKRECKRVSLGPLVQLIKDPDVAILLKKQAIYALREFPSEETLDSLCEIAKDEPGLFEPAQKVAVSIFTKIAAEAIQFGELGIVTSIGEYSDLLFCEKTAKKHSESSFEEVNKLARGIIHIIDMAKERLVIVGIPIKDYLKLSSHETKELKFKKCGRKNIYITPIMSNSDEARSAELKAVRDSFGARSSVLLPNGRDIDSLSEDDLLGLEQAEASKNVPSGNVPGSVTSDQAPVPAPQEPKPGPTDMARERKTGPLSEEELATFARFFFTDPSARVSENDELKRTRQLFEAGFEEMGKGGQRLAYRYKAKDGKYYAVLTPLDPYDASFRGLRDIQDRINPDGDRRDLPCMRQAYEVNIGDGTYKNTIFVEELFPEGKRLSDINKFGWTDAQKARLAASIARTMQYLASKNVLHRDFNPNNIWIPQALMDDPDSIDENPPMVYDFTYARLLDKLGDKAIEDDAFTVGTSGYYFYSWSAPEVVEKMERDPRKDMFGLGTVLAHIFGVDTYGILRIDETRPILLQAREGSSDYELFMSAPARLRDEIENSKAPEYVRKLLLDLMKLNPSEINTSWDQICAVLEKPTQPFDTTQPKAGPTDMARERPAKTEAANAEYLRALEESAQDLFFDFALFTRTKMQKVRQDLEAGKITDMSWEIEEIRKRRDALKISGDTLLVVFYNSLIDSTNTLAAITSLKSAYEILKGRKAKFDEKEIFDEVRLDLDSFENNVLRQLEKLAAARRLLEIDKAWVHSALYDASRVLGTKKGKNASSSLRHPKAGPTDMAREKPAEKDRDKIEDMAKRLFGAGVKARQVYAYLNKLNKPRPVDDPDYLAVINVVGYQSDRELMGEVARAVTDMETKAEYESLMHNIGQQAPASQEPKPGPTDMAREKPSIDTYLKSLHDVTMKGYDQNVVQTSKVLLSADLFDTADAENLKRLIKDSDVEILDPRQLRQRAINSKTSKDKVTIVLSKEEFDNKDIWNGSDKETAVRSSVLLLDGNLAGANYLYLEGVVGLGRALMRQDREAIKNYYKMISGVSLDDNVLDSLKKDSDNTIAFALRAILRFRPITAANTDELERFKKMVETYLIAA